MQLLGEPGSQADASIRTYTQEDPIGLAGGLNLYGFANGDPSNFSDPFGLKVTVVGEQMAAVIAILGASRR